MLYFYRVLILFLVVVLTLTYWLFFVVWIVEGPETNYQVCTTTMRKYHIETIYSRSNKMLCVDFQRSSIGV